MPPVRFEPTISAGERPQTYALDRAATGTGYRRQYIILIFIKQSSNKVSKWAYSTVDLILKYLVNEITAIIVSFFLQASKFSQRWS